MQELKVARLFRPRENVANFGSSIEQPYGPSASPFDGFPKFVRQIGRHELGRSCRLQSSGIPFPRTRFQFGMRHSRAHDISFGSEGASHEFLLWSHCVRIRTFNIVPPENGPAKFAVQPAS